MKSKSVVEKLSALAQESRLAIFRCLVEQGSDGLCAGDISARVGVAPATLSFHLKELSRAGLLKSRQAGRHVYYAADFKAMTALLGYLSENCCSLGTRDEACAPAANGPGACCP